MYIFTKFFFKKKDYFKKTIFVKQLKKHQTTFFFIFLQKFLLLKKFLSAQNTLRFLKTLTNSVNVYSYVYFNNTFLAQNF